MTTRYLYIICVLHACSTMLANADNCLTQSQLWVNAPRPGFTLCTSPLRDSGDEPDLTGFIAEDSNDVPQFTDDPLFYCNRSDESINFYWSSVDSVGENGGTINPDDVTYEIWKVEEWGGMLYPTEQLCQGITGNSFTFSLSDIEGSNLWEQGDQYDNYFGLYPVNDAGRGKGLLTSFIVGAPYELPYHESFADQGIYHYLRCDATRGSVKFSLTDETSSDGDDRCLMTDAEGGSIVEMKIGRMATTKDTTQLAISLHARIEYPTTLNPSIQAYARTPSGKNRHSNSVTIDDSWKCYDLPVPIIGKHSSTEVLFRIIFERKSILYIDAIAIDEEENFYDKGEAMSLTTNLSEVSANPCRCLNLMGMPVGQNSHQSGIYIENGKARFVVRE